MSENTNPHNPGKLFKLVTKTKHRFPLDVKQVGAEQSRSGYPQTERTCELCGAVKVGIHRTAGVFRAWRTSEDAEQVITFLAPACQARDQGEP